MSFKFNEDIWHKNLAFQWFSTLYVAVFGFLVSVLLARQLGVENFGNYSYIVSLAGILLIIQDGGYRAVIYRQNVDGSSKLLISKGIGYLLIVTLVISFFVLFLQPKNWLSILFAILCMSLVVVCGFVSSLLNGVGDFKIDAFWKISIRSATALAILGVLFFYKNVTAEALFLAWIFALLVVLIWPLSKGWLALPSFKFGGNLFSSNMMFLTIEVATVLYFRSDIVLLEYFGNNDGDVGQYSAAYRILEGIILLATPFALISFRSLRLCAKDKKKFFSLFSNLLILMLFIAIFIVTIGGIWGPSLMLLFFGEEYLAAGTLLIWLLLSLLFIFPNYILTQGAIALNRERGYAIVVVVVALFNIVLNIMLIPEFGAVGAAWATIFAEGMLFTGLSWMLFNEWRKN